MDQMKETIKSSEDQIARTISNWNESQSDIGNNKTPSSGVILSEKQENLKKNSKKDVVAVTATQIDEASSAL